ncbi:2-oxo acid dehydrogenase subunit E2 [Actinospica durhamensis]|uniref:Dihydrolipoamide acetyltransferase component of pyruvate dehydrogenase complex n=1 Tax=Actinospica durhamensis TaxID=1508375 RepID=A0A941EQ01_9ACTN|nr:dihydrolipoamide acetyltransferase family protein [Actinospica durhamensis]MBR7831634.1 2-oxo acid dehydrogenase subunit E2 [Actinospica durhamensis]
MALKHFRLPDVGEGLTEAEILGWSVAVGENVTVNQVLVEIETAKAAVELPSPFAGVVRQLLVEPGSTVDVGTPIISIETADAEGDAPVPAASGAGAAEAKREPVLVGYGVSQAATTRRARRAAGAPAALAAPAPVAAAPAPAAPAAPAPVAPAPAPAPTAAVTTSPTHVLAKPLVRKLAKDLGVDLTTIVPARPDGVITREEVERAAESPAPAGLGALAPAPTALAQDRRVPIKGVRKATAAAMVASAFTAPHVTEFLTLDVTRTVKLVERLRAQPDFAGVKVSPLLIAAKALMRAVAKYPEVNASWDEAAQEIVLRGSVNLGIAAATPRGLVVPNVKGAERLSLIELAQAFGRLTATAREGKTALADLTGGTITITNVGVFGVDTGTPILNPGEAAILAFGAIKQQPWVHKGKVKPRWVTTLALSFDHRLIDGELGSRFLRELGRGLEDPAAVLL